MIILIIQLIYQLWYLYSSLIFIVLAWGDIFKLPFFFFPRTGSPKDNPVASSRSVSRTSSCVQQQQTTAKCGIMAVSPTAFTVAMDVIISASRWAVSGQRIRPDRRLTTLHTKACTVRLLGGNIELARMKIMPSQAQRHLHHQGEAVGPTLQHWRWNDTKDLKNRKKIL